MSSATDAEAMFMEGFNCAQAVLACCGRAYGLERTTALQVAQAFGGGIGRTGNICGALSGALMVIGLKHVATDPVDVAAKAKAYRAAQELLKEFRRLHGALTCRELTGCDLSTPEGQRVFSERDMHRTVCAALVRDAAEIIEKLLNKENVK